MSSLNELLTSNPRRIWVFQSAGIGDLVEFVSAWWNYLRLSRPVDHANQLFLNTFYVVNPHCDGISNYGLIDQKNILFMEPFGHKLSDKAKATIECEADQEHDLFFVMMSKIPENITLNPDRAFSPYDGFDMTLIFDSVVDRFRWWYPIAQGGTKYHSPNLNAPPARFRAATPLFNGKIFFSPFARDGGSTAVQHDFQNPAHGRSMSACHARMLYKELIRSNFRVAVVGEPYEWIDRCAFSEIPATDNYTTVQRISNTEWVDAIHGSLAVITVDTGAAHVAAWFRKPTIVLVDNRTLNVLKYGLASVPRGERVLAVPVPLNGPLMDWGYIIPQLLKGLFL